MAFISPIGPGGLASTLNSLINSTASQGSAGQIDDPRAAMAFTSDSRRRILAGFVKQATSILDSVQGQGGHGGLDGSTTATSALVDLTGQTEKAMPTIVMEVNPSSIEFDQPKRYTRQDTQRGTVFHHFTNDKGQNNDILTIRFSGNTGNIWRRARELSDRDKAITRLQIWHNLYQLTREPMVLSDGTANIFYIDYVSPLFPVPITFEGFFTSVLKFTENARKPNSRDYSMEFMVRATSPDMNTIAALILDFVVQEAVATPVATSKIFTQ